MTLKRLKSLGQVWNKIEYQMFRIEKARSRMDVHSALVDGMPRGTGARDKIGELMPDVVEVEAEARAEINGILREKQEIEDWIVSCGDDRFTLLCQYRFAEKLSWEEIETMMDSSMTYNPKTADRNRKYMERCLKKYGCEGLNDD